jgi:glucosamine--fructose-6-phosphate aminotransferase (isomerizing)
MCGIVAYVGKQQASPILLKGLQRLEYRGYDSAGICLIKNDSFVVHKTAGKVSDLQRLVDAGVHEGTIGIGHTRWATHGEPNDRNAHPHVSFHKRLVIVHNGIIENFSSLKVRLQSKGIQFVSDTDTEVLVNFIEDIMLEENLPFDEAVRIALNEVHGAYAIVVMDTQEPRKLVAARKGSPLVLGVGLGEYFFASDASPIIEYTKKVVYLNDSEMVVCDDKGFVVKTIQNEVKTAKIQEIEMELEAIEKGGFDSFMLKEIFEQPKAITDSLRGRLDLNRGNIKMAGLEEYRSKFIHANRIIIVACGTSWHAGLVGEYLIEEFARIPVEVEYASEFRYRDPVINQNDVVIAISQSGETADTLAAIDLAKQRGATIFGICNVIGASIPRATHAGAYTHAGPEIGVASTKAFTAQVSLLTMIAIWLGQEKGNLSQSESLSLMTELEQIPSKIEECLKVNSLVEDISAKIKDSTNALYLGRGYLFPVALEGALKLKEISYIHAEGYPAAEMKHGPIALIDEAMPVIVVAPKGAQYDKLVSNIQEVKARKGNVIAIVTEGDTEVKALADHIIEIPDAPDPLLPLLTVVPLQLLSYHIAVMRGCNVDQPRNLAKSVTVE